MAFYETLIADKRRTVGATGVVAIVAQTNAPATDTTYWVSVNILYTTATTFSITATVAYTDEGNSSRTQTLMFNSSASSTTTTMGNAQGAIAYGSYPVHIRAKGGTSITLATAGTFTTVTYNVEGVIAQLLP